MINEEMIPPKYFSSYSFSFLHETRIHKIRSISIGFGFEP